MNASVARMVSIASAPVGAALDAGAAGAYLSRWGAPGRELAEMLSSKNGFYAFESALLVRPLQHDTPPLGVREWNAPDLWKNQYADNLSDVLFFAEDLFGGQFGLRADGVHAFEPETGALSPISPDLAGWAKEVLSDYDFRTGYPLGHDWQIAHAPLPPGIRLLPKIPFVCGGKYEVENLYSLDDVTGMRFRASIANQIRDLPDGAEITFKVSPPTS